MAVERRFGVLDQGRRCLIMDRGGEPGPGPAGAAGELRQVLAEGAPAVPARASDLDRGQLESDLTAALREVLEDPHEVALMVTDEPGSALLDELSAAWYRLQLARRFHNDAVVQTRGARRQILVQAFILTSRPITDALVAARQRGIDVRVLMDAGQIDKNSSERLRQLRGAGIPVWLETDYRNAHNKVIIIDAPLASATVITGSYNFTWSAQHKNAENILVLGNNPPLAARYAENWQRHRQDADPAP